MLLSWLTSELRRVVVIVVNSVSVRFRGYGYCYYSNSVSVYHIYTLVDIKDSVDTVVNWLDPFGTLSKRSNRRVYMHEKSYMRIQNLLCITIHCIYNVWLSGLNIPEYESSALYIYMSGYLSGTMSGKEKEGATVQLYFFHVRRKTRGYRVR